MNLPILTRMPCVCKHGSIDMEGFHLTAQCPVGNRRFRTHDAIAVTWVAMLRQAGFLCRMEDPNCCREMQDSNKRADIVELERYLMSGWRSCAHRRQLRRDRKSTRLNSSH